MDIHPGAARLEPARTTKWTPTPTALRSPITEIDNMYVIGHFGIARVPSDDWSFAVDGMVRRPLRIDLDQLRAMPSVTVTAVLECFGNPLLPDVPTRRAANVTWRGVPVRTLLRRAGADPAATSLWAAGLDVGEFDGARHGYLKDLPLDVVAARGIVAHELNGEPLSEVHGFPARLFVPGYFGTNNVKWLRSLTVAAHRPEHLFTTQLYQRVEPGSAHPVPVRELDVNSLITSHGESVAVPAGTTRLSGWAWSSATVTGVQVGVDGCWSDATVEPRPPDTFGWQRFSITRDLAPGCHAVAARASDAAGRAQPTSGARNEVHQVTLRAETAD